MASSPRQAKALADALQRAKDSLSSAAATELEATIGLLWPEGEELTDEIIETLCDVVEVYANDASGYAAQYYAESVGETSDVTPADCYKREWTEEAIRSTAAELAGQPQSVIVRRLTDHASRMVSRAAGEYVIQSARKHRRPSSKDAAGVRFARVPGGSETCSFCLMLASRGWVYWSRETAGEFNHYHQNCRCVVVASNEKHPALEGYDPDGLYERYLQCREAVQKSTEGAVDTKSILREMERRDPEWLRTGKPSPIDGDRLTPKRRRELKRTGEWDSILRLSKQGIEVEPQDEDPAAVANIDLKIRGSLWEMKGIYGTGRSIDPKFDEAVSKWARLHAAGKIPTSVPRLVIDITQGSMTDQDAEEAILRNMSYFEDSNEPIKEVLLITHDGSLRRYG